MAQDALLIINPIAGTRKKASIPREVTEFMKRLGIRVDCCETKGPNDAGLLARKGVEEGYSMILGAGGDGTVNEIAEALAHTNVPLGILPVGSGNGLARTLGISQELPLALEVIAERHILHCDRGIVNGRPFYCTFGVGLDAAVSEKFSQMKKRGRSMYIRSFIREFLTYDAKPYAISVNGRLLTEKALLIAVCNASQYGNNVYIAPKAKLSDGLLDITVVHSGNPLETMMMGVDLMAGIIDRHTRIDTFQTKEVVITRLEEGPVHIDGEPFVMGKQMNIHCDCGALKVFAPENDQEFKPIVSPLRALFNDLKYEVVSRFKP